MSLIRSGWRVLAPGAAVVLASAIPASSLFAQAAAAAPAASAQAPVPGMVMRITSTLTNYQPPRPVDDSMAMANMCDDNFVGSCGANNGGGPGGGGGPGAGAGAAAGGRGAGGAGGAGGGGRGARGGGAPGGAPGGGGPGGGGPARTNNHDVYAVSAIPGLARFEITGSLNTNLGGAGGGRGGNASGIGLDESLIATDTAQIILNPDDKTYRTTTLDIGSIVALANALDRKQMVAPVKVSFDTLADTTVDANKAHHYHLDLTYTIYNGGDPSHLTPSTTKVTADYFVMPSSMHFNNPLIGFDQPKPGFSPGLKAQMTKLQQAQDQINAAGFVIRYVGTGTIGTENPYAGTYTRTMEVSGMNQKDIDPAIFQIPADYAKAGRGGRGGGGGN